MYQRVLLASDGTQEGLTALREGALLAQDCGAEVFLLVVAGDSVGVRIADSLHPCPRGDYEQELLERGLAKLARLCVPAKGQVVVGEPAEVIGAWAREFDADLVVVGHRRQGLVERWWSGASGAYLCEHVPCTLLIARGVVSDEAFEHRLNQKNCAGAGRVSPEPVGELVQPLA